MYHYERRVCDVEKPEIQDESYIEVLTPVLKYQKWQVTGQKDVQVDQNYWERADRKYQHRQLQKVGTKQELKDDYRYETRAKAYDSYRWEKTGRKVPKFGTIGFARRAPRNMTTTCGTGPVKRFLKFGTTGFVRHGWTTWTPTAGKDRQDTSRDAEQLSFGKTLCCV